MAKIIKYTPEPESYDICSNCKEKLKVITIFNDDDTTYPACSNCEEIIENIWPEWKPAEVVCEQCKSYAKFFDRSYGEAYCVYHKDHCCICGHPHIEGEPTCINKQCDCSNFLLQEEFIENKKESKQ